jgi:hypothetical protein
VFVLFQYTGSQDTVQAGIELLAQPSEVFGFLLSVEEHTVGVES